MKERKELIYRTAVSSNECCQRAKEKGQEKAEIGSHRPPQKRYADFKMSYKDYTASLSLRPKVLETYSECPGTLQHKEMQTVPFLNEKTELTSAKVPSRCFYMVTKTLSPSSEALLTCWSGDSHIGPTHPDWTHHMTAAGFTHGQPGHMQEQHV